ncbi:hypothetical protein UP10_01280 [Bradyrhizobium sp. LTSPM299]|nr:hypothetical protein UP10_01280 [Bradyrhizobium sp. LTSPM299]
MRLERLTTRANRLIVLFMAVLHMSGRQQHQCIELARIAFDRWRSTPSEMSHLMTIQISIEAGTFVLIVKCCELIEGLVPLPFGAADNRADLRSPA